MTQVVNGNAFEYACVTAVYDIVRNYQPVAIIRDRRFVDCKQSFDLIEPLKREQMMRAAKCGVKSILGCEPYLSSANAEGIEVRLNSSSTGEKGDVRDILISHKATNWEIGISSKHNHNAVKHQRLSPTINFGQKWFQIDTPTSYFDELQELWAYLKQQKQLGMVWSAVDKPKIYGEVLHAFKKALEQMSRENYDVASKFLEYLLGRYDFYKVIILSKEQQTVVRAFNIHNTLHRKSPSGSQPVMTSRMILPKNILKIDIVDESNILIYFDKGWTVKMRIHSAKTLVEPSLKFDVQLEGVPETMLNMRNSW